MNRRNIIGGMVLVLAISGCGADATQATLPAVAEVTTTRLPVAPATESIATVPAPTSDAGQTAPPLNPLPSPVPKQRFVRIYFVDVKSTWVPVTVFPLGIQEIFVVLNYENMLPGDVVRRVWLNNGAIWAEREEAWDYDRYGSSGSTEDVSIFDRDEGLPAGDWELQLYVNGVLQTAEERFFSIAFTRDWETTSPDGSRTAWVENKKVLVVDGLTLVEIGQETTNQLGHFDWYPDSQHLLYTELIRETEWPSGPLGPRYKLWTIDIANGDRTLVAGEADYLHTPVISPDGKHAAMVLGNGFGDACNSGWALGIVSIHEDLTLSDSVNLYEFAGFPDVFDSVYPVDAPDLKRPGRWEDAEHLVVALQFTCTPQEAVLTLPGIYRINIIDQTVERIGDLPLE